MFKRLFLILLVLASVGVIIYTLWQTDIEETRQETLLHHVADDALIILDVEDAQGFHSKLKDGSVLWPDLQRVRWASHLDGLSADIDSLLAPVYTLHPDSSISYILSLHPSGQQDFGWMLTVSIGDQTNIQNLLSRTRGYIPSEERLYNGSSIYTLSNEDQGLFATLNEDVLQLSKSNLVIERAVRTEYGKMMQKEDFLRSYDTRGKHSLAHVHIDWLNFPEVLKSLFSESIDKHMQDDFAGWATSDILSDANSIYIHGLVQTSDSLGHHLSTYRLQGEGSYTNFLDLCPYNTASFSYRHISKHKLWSGDGAPIDDSLSALLGTGFMRAQLESSGEELSRDFYIITLDDVEQMKHWFQKGSPSIEKVLGHTTYQEFDCSSLDPIYGPFLEKMIGCIIKEHLILTSSSVTMKEILLSQQTKRTLKTDEHFMQLNDDMDDEAALCYYFNIARSKGLIERVASKELKASLGEDPSSLQQFQALVIQYGPASDGLFHQNVLLRHNPIYKKETSSLWEFSMDTLIQGEVCALKNHYTNQYELLVQDTQHDIHLIDNTGRTLWTIPLDETIRSSIHQVDLYKNGKLQMAFNTDTRFIILDRNGEMLDEYPVMLSDTASSRLSVLDYDKKRKYRFLIGTQDGVLHNFDKEGKAVKGWKYNATQEPIIGDIQHFLIGKKDYVSVIGSKGSLRFLERNGKLRYSASEKPLSDYDGGMYRVETAKKIGDARIMYMDEDGRLTECQVDGPFKVIEDDAITDLRTTSDYLIHEDDQTIRYNFKGEEKSRIEHEFDREFSFPEIVHKDYVGIADRTTGLYYLYDVLGDLVEGFPLPGSSTLIKDLNTDGTLDAVLWDDTNVSMYSISVR